MVILRVFRPFGCLLIAKAKPARNDFTARNFLPSKMHFYYSCLKVDFLSFFRCFCKKENSVSFLLLPFYSKLTDNEAQITQSDILKNRISRLVLTFKSLGSLKINMEGILGSKKIVIF